MKNERYFDSSKMVERLYEIILHPEKMNDFIADWEKYIDQRTEPYRDRQNSTGLSDVVLSDDGLEVHFARVYAIITKFGRHQKKLGEGGSDFEQKALLQFDTNGVLLDGQCAPQNSPFQAVRHAEEVAGFLTEDAAEAWQSFLARTQHAPQIESLNIFALEEGGNLIGSNIRDEGDGHVRIVLRELNVAWSSKLRSLLQEHFSLTNGELILTEHLTAQGSLDAIAKSSNKSTNTLRSQLKSIFRKMNVSSQAAVMQSVAMLSSICETLEYAAPDQHAGISRGEVMEVEVDGVTVPVHLFGPKRGHPIVFIHGMLDGVALPKKVLSALQRHNLRFISPVRPNYGNASSHPDIAKAPEVFAAQLKAVVEQLDLEDVYLLGHMSGGLYAFAASPVLGNRLKGIINISCGVPILSTKQFSNLSRRQKAYAFTTRYAPAFLPTLLRAGVAQIDSAEIETLLDDMYPKVSPDRDLLESDADTRAVVLDGYRFAVAQGYKGFQSDALQVTRNWSDYVQANRKPVLLIHGHHDPAAAYDYVPPFAEREGFQLKTYPSDGQLMLYGKPGQVLGDIRAFIDDTI